MKRYRVERRRNETADLFALRAFVMAMPEMNLNQLWAFTQWIASTAEAEKMRRQERERDADISFGNAALVPVDRELQGEIK